MKQEPSDWYFPRDWRWILSWYFVVMPIALISFLFFLGISEARQGNPILLYVALVLGLVGVTDPRPTAARMRGTISSTSNRPASGLM
jgi:hypothetical protein